MKTQQFNILFNINYKCDFGLSLYISGNIPALGLWDPSKALPMNWIEGHNWFKEVSAADEIQEINYKYFIASEKDLNPEQVVWEKGSNRHIKLSSSSSQLTQNDTWEHRDVKLMLKDPLPEEFKSRKEFYLCGDVLNIMKVPHPIKMRLKEMPEVQNPAERSSFWTANLCLHYTIINFEYKYTLYDIVKQSFYKNRKVSKSFLRPDSTATFPFVKYQRDFSKNAGQALRKQDLRSSSDEFEADPVPSEIYHWHEAKVDYVKYSDFIYDRISPCILLGASINEPEEVSILKAEGVDVIFNLQMPEDIRRHNPNHTDVVRCCKYEKIEYFSFPINEKNAEEVVLRCNKASKILKDLLDESKVVYLHCTYGAVRSVHSLISYLCLFEKYEVGEAIEFVQGKRALAIPSIELAKGIIQVSM